MRSRLPLVLSSMALVIAIFGSTPFGRAAIATAVPLAKRAYLADTAKNAIKVDNIKASRTPTPGMLLPLDASGKLPESIGAVGPKGDKGDKGDKGKTGDSGATKVLVRFSSSVNGVGTIIATANCLTGEKATGGGYISNASTVAVSASFPVADSSQTAIAWTVKAYNPTNYTIATYVVCSSP